ncbi:nitroreductase family deazaflavin-dependent oxidoreductase [Cellulomonas sp. URHE0023]|uniref:nitroreductase family deazaflavin-dependent oxidoreductase n=1 Tax=Cellulomonas sp. URHE0023 TaxID=1380354 RepID=UPI00047F43F4|nr:nitroreductase family deazaflavin-dependent oxidoreductase [Cellulomonas sp. URHE0023]
MSIEKLPAGTRGARSVPRLIQRLTLPIRLRMHHRAGDKMGGMDLLYISTVGAKSGERRIAPVARFDDGDGAWLVVASAGGQAKHPAWYVNLVAHPDAVEVEVSGVRHRVVPEQLVGAGRAEAWNRITSLVPGFAGYESKTDRPIPVLRLRSAGLAEG